jgi:DNA-binding GntR family transcriptional regulator
MFCPASQAHFALRGTLDHGGDCLAGSVAEPSGGGIRHHREIITATEAKDRIFASPAMAVHLQIGHMIFRRNQTADPTAA